MQLPAGSQGDCLQGTDARLIGRLIEGSLTSGTADGIPGHATACKQEGMGIDQATVWGDYFLLLTLEKCSDKRMMRILTSPPRNVEKRLIRR